MFQSIWKQEDKIENGNSGDINSVLKGRSWRLWILIGINLLIWVPVLKIFGADAAAVLVSDSDNNSRLIREVIKTQGNNAVIIKGQIAHEGDIIDGYKIVKITKNNVLLEWHGKELTASLR